MGSSQSASFRSQPVVLPPSHYVPTINKRFVKDRVVTLELHDQFWTQPRDHDYVIRDVTINQPVFKVGRGNEADASAQHLRRLLLDAYGVAVVGMERHDKPPVSAEYTVIPGGTASKTPMCTFTTQMIGAYHRPLLLDFTDPVSGKPMAIGAEGCWQARDAVITITGDARRRDTTFCIARIYCDGSPLDGVYKMDVAAGVDLSLVVLLAAALEEQTKKHVSTSDRVEIRHAIKAAKKRSRQTPTLTTTQHSNRMLSATSKPVA